MLTADRSLISKCLSGDSAAFGLLVDRYKESIYALAYSKLGNFHDAEDITQEAFIKAYRNLRKLRHWDDFHAWMYAITSNLCKDWIRNKSRKPDCEFIEDQVPESLNYSLDEDKLKETLHEAMDSLPEIYRQVLSLYYLGGMNTTEIAKFLRVSQTSIYQRLSRARSLLRKEMIDMMGEAFKQQRLRAGFTFRIVEAIERINLNPITPRTLPWGFSIAIGIIIAVMSIGTRMNPFNLLDPMSGRMLSGEPAVQKVGEIPVHLLKASNTTVISNQVLKGTASSPMIPYIQNAFFMAPQFGEGVWTKKADMPIIKWLFGYSTVNGKIYTIGGSWEKMNGIHSTTEEYNPETDKWVNKAELPEARYALSASAFNGKIYAIGGFIKNNVNVEIATNIVEEYNPKTNKWTQKTDMQKTRAGLSTCTINDKIYAIGGVRSLWEDTFYQTVEEYDPDKDIWVTKADMPTARAGLSTSVVNGKIYAIGGTNKQLGPYDYVGLSTVEEYDPVNDKWTKKADMPTPRFDLSTVVIDNKIFAIGGINRFLVTPAVEIYDPETDKWTEGINMPTARACLGAGVIDGRIYTFGGYIPWAGVPTVEVFDTGLKGKSINLKGKLPGTWGEIRTQSLVNGK